MTREQAKREIDSLDFYLQNHTDDYGEESHTAMMMAIKALEQQTCEDAVSREAVLDIFADNADATRPYGTAWEEVKALPSVKPQPKTKWIPVSERLPLLKGSHKISDDVLITNGFENDMGYFVERKGKIFWHYYGGECEVGIKDEDNDAIAWMSLPEPYKAESEDKG